MLKSKSVANLIQTTLNNNDKDEKFRVVYELGNYRGAEINCLLKQGKGTITPIANYTNIKTPFRIEIITPVQCGKERIDTIIDVVNDCIMSLNGKVKSIDNGKAVFLFNPIEIGDYEVRASAGQSVLIKIEFFVEYSSNVGTKYEMALITTPFDYGTINVRYFETREEQTAWFENKIDDADYSEILTPNINSLVITQQRYLNAHNVELNKLINKNYAIIKETSADSKVKYYYYYITNANIDQYNLVVLDLSMDTLQTHYIDLEFGDCFISKADINRWVEVDAETVRFDTSVNSELFEREDIQNVTKRVVKRDVLNKFGNNLYNGVKINKWIEENVFGWYYIFLSSNTLIKSSVSSYDDAKYGKTIKLKPFSYARKETEDTEDIALIETTSLHNSMVCVAFPVMKNLRKIYFGKVETIYPESGQSYRQVQDAYEISNESLKYFLKNTSPEFIYAIKFSKVCPFKYMSGSIVDVNFTDSEDGNLLLYGDEIENKFNADTNEHTYKALKPKYNNIAWEIEGVPLMTKEEISVDAKSGLGMFNCLLQVNIDTKMYYTLEDVNYEFKKSEIINSDHDIKFNPKLLSSDYKGILLSDSLQNGTEYDILKLGKKDLEISYTEALTPDISRRYIRFSDLDGYYISELSENLTGYVVTDDTSLTLENDQYRAMLANNKNFFIQNDINRVSDKMGAVIGGFSSLASVGAGFIGGGLGGAIGLIGASSTGISSANTLLNSEKALINEKLTIDNLKNAPNSINGAKGNVIFNAMYSEMGVVVEIHDILPNEKKIVDDTINMYGMTFNKIDNIKKYDNIRAYHNYIQANIEDIQGEISKPIRDDIRQRFANGVRFWNDDDINYSKENYERWLKA